MSGWTSIGDGLDEALNQLASSPTENSLCSFVLLSDGMENSSLYWADVSGAVIASGCPVTAIAFGPESDETLMQQIATDTGGLYFYNDVYVSTLSESATATTAADMALDLGSTYEYAEGKAEGRQRLLAEKGVVSEKDPEAKHEVLVDETVYEAIFALDWYERWWAELELILVDPAGKTYDQNSPGYSFEEHRPTGTWAGASPTRSLAPGQMIVKWLNSEEQTVPYQVLVSGRTHITLDLLLPDRLGTNYYTGNLVPIYAFLSAARPIAVAMVNAYVTAPDGTETLVPLNDDGESGDGAANDGFYAGMYTVVNQANVVEPQGEDAQSNPKDEGGYRVLAVATHEKVPARSFRRLLRDGGPG